MVEWRNETRPRLRSDVRRVASRSPLVPALAVVIALFVCAEPAGAASAATPGWESHWGGLFVGIAVDINRATGRAPVRQVRQQCDAAVADVTAFKKAPSYPGVKLTRWRAQIDYLNEEARACAETAKAHPRGGFVVSSAVIDLSGAFQELYDLIATAHGNLGGISPTHA
jgi:hypothetical protein